MTRIALPSLLLLALAGCGGGGGGSGGSSPTPSGPATVEVSTWYDAPANTQLESRGPVVAEPGGVPTSQRHGLWKFYFPADQGGGLQWERTYTRGAWDEARFWREYNPDTSLRYDWRDR